MKSVANILLGILAGLIIGAVFLTIRNRQPDSPSTGTAQQLLNPFPTFTSTPLAPPSPIPTPIPLPTNTPVPPPTPLPPQDWGQLAASAHRVQRDDLMRYHKEHLDKIVYFEGIAQQVLGDEHAIAILLNVFVQDRLEYVYQGNVYLGYQDYPVRVMKNDQVEIVGRFVDLYTYDSVGQGPITVPWIEVIQLRIIDK